MWLEKQVLVIAEPWDIPALQACKCRGSQQERPRGGAALESEIKHRGKGGAGDSWEGGDMWSRKRGEETISKRQARTAPAGQVRLLWMQKCETHKVD